MNNHITDLGNVKMCKNRTECLHPRGPLLPVEEFYTRKGSADGRMTVCKACHRARARNYEQKPRGIPSRESEQRVINKLRSVGIYATPGKRGEWAHIDVLAWGCVRVEVKTAKNKKGQFIFPLGHKTVERFLAHDVVMLVCLHDGQLPTFHLFLSSDSIFYNGDKLKNGVAYQPMRAHAKKRQYATLSNELMFAHQNRWTLIEDVRLQKSAEMLTNSGELDTPNDLTAAA